MYDISNSKNKEKEIMNGEVLAFVLYFAILIIVGIYFFFKERKEATQANFFLGGRKMGPWVTAM